MGLHDREEWGEAEPPGDMTDKMVYPSRANVVGLMVVTDAGGSGMRLNRVGVVAASLLFSVVAGGCSAPFSSHEHVTYIGRIEQAPEVTSVSHVAWEWDAPEGRVLRDVLAGTGGAIMVLSDGVIGLDGTTGTEQWRYRSPDDSLVRAEATPEGSTVVLTYRGKDEGELDVVVLEAATGELRGQYPASADGGDQTTTLTEEARLVHPDEGSFGVEATLVDTGEPLWDFVGRPPKEAGQFFAQQVSTVQDMVVVSAVFADGGGEGFEPGAEVDQVLSVVGLDAHTGALVWHQELPYVFGRVAEPGHTLSQGGEVLLVEVGGASGEGQRWLLDPATGEQLSGGAFSQGQERRRVALLGDGYVEKAQGQGRVQYWVRGFDGAQREHVEVAARSGERYLHPGVVTDQGVLRLDYVTEPDWARGEVGAEFLSWDGGEATVVPVDLSPNESLLVDIEGSTNADVDAPRLVPVPGSFVVTEEHEASVRAVGLS